MVALLLVLAVPLAVLGLLVGLGWLEESLDRESAPASRKPVRSSVAQESASVSIAQ